MPTSSAAHRNTEPVTRSTGPRTAPLPMSAATVYRFPSRGDPGPVDESPPGTRPVTPLQVYEARIREMAHHQQDEKYAHTELEACVTQLEGGLAHSREAERKKNDALISCVASEARVAVLAAPIPQSFAYFGAQAVSGKAPSE
jgi:hypothetical protein